MTTTRRRRLIAQRLATLCHHARRARQVWLEIQAPETPVADLFWGRIVVEERCARAHRARKSWRYHRERLLAENP